MSVEFDPVPAVPIAPPGPSPGEAAGRGAGVRKGAGAGPGLDRAREAVARANEALEAGRVSVRFRVDLDTDQIVVSVVDEATGEVVRQIPAEEQLAIEAHLRALTGLLFSRTA